MLVESPDARLPAIAEAPHGNASPIASLDWDALASEIPVSRYAQVRYVFDWLLGLALLVVLAPLITALAVSIRLDSAGPVFFRQTRAGRFTKPFIIVKFRTMHTSAPRSSLKVSEDDPRITRVGRFLRRTGLDELPQLLNVVRGEMALIGPRPEQIGLLSLYESWQHERHLLKPGITGWWQIHHRDSVPMHLNVEKDIHYVRNVSLRLDLIILIGTLGVLLSPVIRVWRNRRLDPAPEVPALASQEDAS